MDLTTADTDMERNRLLSLSLLVLSAISVLLFVTDGLDHGDIDADLFRLPEGAAPDQISMVRGVDSVVLTRNGGSWKVNGLLDRKSTRLNSSHT